MLKPKPQRYGGLRGQENKHRKAHDDTQVFNVEKKLRTL